jgi:protoheme IX farnesyltransferase
MSIASKAEAPAVVPIAPLTADGTLIGDICMLTKPRLSSLVLLSTAIGFYIPSQGPINFMLLLDTLIGTALVAAGASILNQFLERDTDKLMVRTRTRPLPSGRMNPISALYAGAAASIIGMLFLALRVNLDASLWATLTLALYVFAYTPLKRKSTLNTLVGAVPGALPPLIGWAAASDGEMGVQPWAIFALIFIWQLPHFLAIAWIYRADYERAGLKMLPGVDSDGFSTGRQIVVQCLTLIPTSLLPVFVRITGGDYMLGAVVLGLGFLAFGINFAARRTDSAARLLFLASVIYLPLVLGLLAFTRYT